MLPDPIQLVVMPTRIANFVHYLTHGRTLPQIITNQEAFEEMLAQLKATAKASENAKDAFIHFGTTYKQQAALIQKNTKQDKRG